MDMRGPARLSKKSKAWVVVAVKVETAILLITVLWAQLVHEGHEQGLSVLEWQGMLADSTQGSHILEPVHLLLGLFASGRLVRIRLPMATPPLVIPRL